MIKLSASFVAENFHAFEWSHVGSHDSACGTIRQPKSALSSRQDFSDAAMPPLKDSSIVFNILCSARVVLMLCRRELRI